MRAPKRRTEPAYYDVVTDPIDMLRIQQKLKMDEYTTMEELKEDFERLFKNAYSYYKKGSPEFKDATELSELFAKALGRHQVSCFISHCKNHSPHVKCLIFPPFEKQGCDLASGWLLVINR